MKHMNPSATSGAIELKGDDDPVDVAKEITDLKAVVDTRLKAVETKADTSALVARLDGLEAKLNRPNGGDDKADPSEEQKAFGVYLRHGKEAGPDTLKTLRVSSDAAGGYLAPEEFSTEFLREVADISPIRSIASVRTTGAPSVIYPSRTGITNAKWKGENQTQEASEPSFGEVEIPVKEINTYVDVSNQLLQDSAGAAEREVRAALAEDFAEKEGLAFVSGNGALEPEGFMTDSGVPFTVNGHATVLASDALITLMHAVQGRYRNVGSWVMNGATLAVIRKLKDGQGNYLWQQSYAAGVPQTLLGRPIVEAPDMPDVGSGTFPIAFGDFNAGYRIIDRIGLSIMVNPYTRATEGVTRFHATRRVGAGVIRPLALRKLKMST